MVDLQNDVQLFLANEMPLRNRLLASPSLLQHPPTPYDFERKQVGRRIDGWEDELKNKDGLTHVVTVALSRAVTNEQKAKNVFGRCRGEAASHSEAPQ